MYYYSRYMKHLNARCSFIFIGYLNSLILADVLSAVRQRYKIKSFPSF